MQLARNSRERYPSTTPGKLAQQLGWFSIALGLTEVLATRRLTRTLGMHGDERTLRLYGVREIISGIGLLTSPNPTPWLWTRVAGDALDLGTMAKAYQYSNKQRNLTLAMANVAVVTALDVMCAQQMGAITERQQMPMRDYSDRSGLPMGLEASRGVARDAASPQDFATPAALRPFDAQAPATTGNVATATNP